MRLLYVLKTEMDARNLSQFLKSNGVNATFEAHVDPDVHTIDYQVWVESDKDAAAAEKLVPEFEKRKDGCAVPPQIPRQEFHTPPEKSVLRVRKKCHTTKRLIGLCIILYVIMSFQALTLAKQYESPRLLMYTGIMRTLSFDYTKAEEARWDFIKSNPRIVVKTEEEILPQERRALFNINLIPHWTGIYQALLDKTPMQEVLSMPMFEKIKQWQVWRLITPCVLHGNIVHILFNMLWLFLLGMQVEPRLGVKRYLILSCIIGLTSNLGQYLMSGPSFLGYSGIICGLAAFIWVRQNRVPWEGYAMQRMTLVFLLIVVLAITGYQAILFGLNLLDITSIQAPIANTAHIVGGITGWILGYFKYFDIKNVSSETTTPPPPAPPIN